MLAAGVAISITALDPFRFKDSLMARVLTFGLAAAAAFTLAGCNFVRDDINRTLGRSPEDQVRRTDIAASQVTRRGGAITGHWIRASSTTFSTVATKPAGALA